MKNFSSVFSIIVSKSSSPLRSVPNALSVAAIWGAGSEEQQQRVINLGVRLYGHGQIDKAKVKVDSKSRGRTKRWSGRPAPVTEAVRIPRLGHGYVKKEGKGREKTRAAPCWSLEMSRVKRKCQQGINAEQKEPWERRGWCARRLRKAEASKANGEPEASWRVKFYSSVSKG